MLARYRLSGLKHRYKHFFASLLRSPFLLKAAQTQCSKDVTFIAASELFKYSETLKMM